MDDSFAYFCVSLIVAGLAIVCVGYFWLFSLAFEKGVWWGVGCLLIPLVPLIFVAREWRVAR